jgi:hypothetical protein
MGQTIGRAPLLPGPKHFTNLPKSNIYELWEAFNDVRITWKVNLISVLLVLTPNPTVPVSNLWRFKFDLYQEYVPSRYLVSTITCVLH